MRILLLSLLLLFSSLLACGSNSNPTGNDQQATISQLWGWWLAEWPHPDGRTLSGVYAFLQDRTVYYDEYTERERRVFAGSGEYKYDSITNYLSILWSDENEWERPFDRYFGGDTLKAGDRTFIKQSAPPDWAK